APTPPAAPPAPRRAAAAEELMEPTVARSPREGAVPSAPPVASVRPASASVPARKPPADALSEMLVRSNDQIPVGVMIDELLDELVHQLEKEDARQLSPMAIRWVKLSPNLRADLAQSVEARLSARLGKATEIVQVVCTDCRSLRSRIEGGDWVVSLGAVHQTDLWRMAQDIGAKTFLDLDIEYTAGPPESMVILSARAFRASDARVMFASAIRGDETTAAVLRTGKKPPSREEEVAELNRKLEARPAYGINVALGAMWIPYAGPGGTFTGATFSATAFERFGAERRHRYGIRAEGFLNVRSTAGGGSAGSQVSGLQAGMLWALSSWQATAPDLNKPELILNWGLGAFLASGASNEGNSLIFESSADYMMKFRFSFGGGITYMVPTKFANYDLGGVGARVRFAFHW